jgi:hypothetical protein
MASAEKLAALGLDPTVIRLLTKKSGGGGAKEEKKKKPALDAVESEVSPTAAPTGGIQDLGDIPAFTPEEQESLVGKVGRKTLGGLQWVGETLDKPGRAVRGVLAGRPGELLNLLPLSDTIGITDPEQATTGRDLSEQYGLLNKNKPGLDMGDVLGFGVEVATDPLSWLSLGGATVAKNVLKGGQAAEKALTAASRADEIAAGTRSLFNFHTPTIGLPLPSKIPFTKIKIPTIAVPVKELGSWGTGEKAASIYRAVQFGKYSPNPWVRKFFSPIAEVADAPIKDQEKMLRMHEDRVHALDAVAEEGMGLFDMQDTARDKFNQTREKALYGSTPGGENYYRAEALKQAYAVSDEVKAKVHAEFGVEPVWEGLMKDPESLVRSGRLYDEITSKRKEYGELADTLRNSFNELTAQITSGLKDPDLSSAHWFDDSIRAFVEQKDGFNKDFVLDTMKNAGLTQGVEGLDEAADAMYQLSDRLRELYSTHKKEFDQLGINVEDVNDYFVGYSHRRPDYELGSPVANYLKKRVVQGTAPFMISRDAMYRDLPGGTKKINHITRDLMFTGVKHQRDVVDRLYGELGNIHRPDQMTPPQPGSYLEAAWKAATEYGLSKPTMIGIAKEIKNLDSEARRGALAARKMLYETVGTLLGPGWRSSVNTAVKNDADWRAVPYLDEAMQGLSERFGMDPDDVWEQLKNHNRKAHTPKTGDQIANEAMAQYEKLRAENPDSEFFSLASDPTSFPDASFGGSGLKWSLDNAAFLLAQKYDLPAWWRYEEMVRNKLKESANPRYAAIAKENLSEHQFKQKLWDEVRLEQQSLPEEMRWADDVSDVDDFIIEFKNNTPEVADIPQMSQTDLHDMVKRLYHMPKEILQDGLFNRTTTTDAVDYLMQATKLKSGVVTLRKMLKQDGILSETGTGPTLAEVWKGMKLTDNGRDSLLKEMFADKLQGLSEKETTDALAKMANTLKVDPDIADMTKRYIELFQEPGKTQKQFTQIIDQVNSLFKGQLTIPYPAFHTRNRIGGFIANWVAGIHDGEADKIAHDMFFGRVDPELTEKYLRELKLNNVYSVGTGGGSTAALQRVEQYKGIEESKLPVGGGLTSYIANPFGEFIADTKDAYKSGGLSRVAKQWVMGGKTTSGKTAVDLNPFGISGGIDPLGYKGRAGELNQFGEPMTKLEQMKAPDTTFLPAQVGTRANDYIEWMNRVGPYIALRKNGWSPAMAARKVKQVQFDYREMSRLERDVFKRVIPFYSFMRKNLEQQVNLLMSNPGGRTAQLIRAENNANREGKSNGSYVPKYLAESFSVRLPGGTENDAKFYSQSGLFPAEEAFNRFAFDDSGFPINIGRTTEKFLSQAHPLIQGPLEQLSGRQFWSGRKLQDLYQTPTDNQDINLMLSKMPHNRAVNTIGGLFDSRKSIPLRAFNFTIGGAKVTDVNVAKQRALELRDILETELPKDKDIAEFTGLYASDLESLINRFNSGDQEAAKMLKLYGEMKKSLKEIKKAESDAKAE